jgi:hypothetical protein
MFATSVATLYAVMSLMVFGGWLSSVLLTHQRVDLRDVIMGAIGFPIIALVLFILISIVFFPITALYCVCYNQAAKITDGIEFNVF